MHNILYDVQLEQGTDSQLNGLPHGFTKIHFKPKVNTRDYIQIAHKHRKKIKARLTIIFHLLDWKQHLRRRPINLAFTV